jgi:hypothetical protein
VAGWNVTTVGIYPGIIFPMPERGATDIVLDDQIDSAARADMLFYDLHVARLASMDHQVLDQLRETVERVAPDVIHVEHPWPWLVLRDVLRSASRPRLVYSSPNIEWRFRPDLFRFGLKRPGAETLVDDTRALEVELASAADLVVAISDVEANELRQLTTSPVVYVPPASDLADLDLVPSTNRFSAQAARGQLKGYGALMGSRYWPNVEGFFEMFPAGMGFLSVDEQLWVCGTIGGHIEADPRFQDFLSVNSSRMRFFGFLPEEEKAAFLSAAACVPVPIRIGAGSKLKTADAIASGRPVIITPHALEGYGPLVREALGSGIYVTDTPREFRQLIRQALLGELVGCPIDVRRRLSPRLLSARLDAAYRALLSDRELPSSNGRSVAEPSLSRMSG